MKITIDEIKERVISTVQKEFDKIWLECTSEIYQAERLIYSVDIDGQVLYNQYEEFIHEHLQQIKHIQIKTLSKLESIQETEEQMSQYLNKFVPGMNAIADRMYGDMNAELWGELASGLEGLQWIVKSFEFLEFLYNPDVLNYSILANFYTNLKNIIKDLDANLSGDDLVAVADLIKYELVPCLEKYKIEFGGIKVELS
ncbi:hypothetical protein [Paenibacillus segetis]|uniref:Uncharacterized protein n=1 Tax=Paenibacillus segetis TaxID=1325360 RepID=A0ABQ1YNS3_9BACL|nr:hypothetical protein [Paenibacillus segetis]GGH33041.1 hypothetical protein GCM10008013_37840 [Paenibacillus segetis]